MEFGLSEKVVLITGGSRGIGRATAIAFAQEHAQVMVCARGQAPLDQAVAELNRLGAQAAAVSCDVATPDGAAAAVAATLERFGRLDVLVNNVGGSQGTGAFDQTPAEAWRAVVDANLMAAVWCSQRAVDWMKGHGGGAIVHLNSIYGREYASSTAYGAAKAAVTALTKDMAVDLARFKIRVNGVAPGSILFEGGSWDRRQKEKPEQVAKLLREDLPWGRFGQPEEVARAVVFLASQAASWVTGATLPVDGGQGRAF